MAHKQLKTNYLFVDFEVQKNHFLRSTQCVY